MAGVYVARVERGGTIRIYDDDRKSPVAVVTVLPGANLRRALAAAGWRPAGGSAQHSGRGVLLVEPLRRR